MTSDSVAVRGLFCSIRGHLSLIPLGSATGLALQARLAAAYNIYSLPDDLVLLLVRLEVCLDLTVTTFNIGIR